MGDKDSLQATAGEILPEFALPAVLKAPNAIKTLLGRTLYGAGTGAGLTGGYEAIKEQSGIKEGLDTNIAMATGIGGVIGGIVGGLTKNPALGKTIGEAFVAGDDKAKEAILQTYPEARSVVEQYFKDNGLAPSKNQPAYIIADDINPVTGDVVTTRKNRDGVTKSDTIEPDIIPLPKKVEVKGRREKKLAPTDDINPLTGDVETTSKSLTTKHGTKQTSTDVNEAVRTLEEIEYDVLNPKPKLGKELKGQKETNTENIPKTFKITPQASGRMDYKGDSIQGDATDMAMFTERKKEPIVSAKTEVDRRMKIYDNNKALEDTSNISKKQLEVDRLRFAVDNFISIGKDRSLSKEIRNEAYKELENLNKKKIYERENKVHK
jgi:hypothetical protein